MCKAFGFHGPEKLSWRLLAVVVIRRVFEILDADAEIGSDVSIIDQRQAARCAGSLTQKGKVVLGLQFS